MSIIEGRFLTLTEALVAYVRVDAICPGCREVLECAPRCRWIAKHSDHSDRIVRARVALDHYLKTAGLRAA